MDNYLVINDVDTCFISQHSWMILLEKQLNRNLYLMKLHQLDHKLKKIKIHFKEMYEKMKSAIHQNIRVKIKKKKHGKKVKIQNVSQCTSSELRRKTEEEIDILFNLKFINKRNSTNKYHKLPENDHELTTSINQDKKPKSTDKKNKKHNQNFLPSTKQSPSQLQNISSNYYKRQIRKSVQNKFQLSKPLYHSKPILSLHELQFSTRKLACFNQNFPMQNRPTLIQQQKVLIRSSMISSPSRYDQPSSIAYNSIFTKKMSGKQFLQHKKRIERNKLLLFANNNNSNNHHNELLFSHVNNQWSQIKDSLRQQLEQEQQNQSSSLRSQSSQHYSATKKKNSLQKTQQTKQSDEQYSGSKIQSIIIEQCVKQNNQNHNNNRWAMRQSFGDVHISSRNSLMKNYRISRIKNIRHPNNC